MDQRNIEQIAIGELRPDPKNARRHSPAQVRQIAASIEAFGFNTPILVDRDNLIISGHGRLLALQRLGRSHAPVIRLEHLSPEAARAFAIAESAVHFNQENLRLLVIRGPSLMKLVHTLYDRAADEA